MNTRISLTLVGGGMLRIAWAFSAPGLMVSPFGEDLWEMGEMGCVIRGKGVEVVKVGLQEAEVDLLFEERRDRAVEVVRHVPEAHGRGEIFEHAEGGGEGGAL